jgi:hypothetical protein
MAAYGHMVRLNGGFGEKIATGRSWPGTDLAERYSNGRCLHKAARRTRKLTSPSEWLLAGERSRSTSALEKRRYWPVADRRHTTLTDRSDLKPAAQAAKDASAYRTAASVASVAGANGRFEKARPASLGRTWSVGACQPTVCSSRREVTEIAHANGGCLGRCSRRQCRVPRPDSAGSLLVVLTSRARPTLALPSTRTSLASMRRCWTWPRSSVSLLCPTRASRGRAAQGWVMRMSKTACRRSCESNRQQPSAQQRGRAVLDFHHGGCKISARWLHY